MQNKHRLPGHIAPERYRLIIKPDFETFDFWGEETLYFRLKTRQNEIILHAKELRVVSAEARAGKVTAKALRIAYDAAAETVVFDFGKALPKGKAELRLEFVGKLNDKMRGFYRSRYLHEGREKYLATTQFEATDARRAFPCFDEPAAKAIFDVSLIVPEKMTAVSNTVESGIFEHSAGLKRVEFLPTPKMSTYLLAFIVGDLEYIEAKTKRGVLVRVFTTPGKKSQATFALDCAVRSLDFYEHYFNLEYPLPILDMVAVPDFASAAMENWGAIVYRETALLVDDASSSAATRQWVAIVVAHEIAHMWFGNLVTMEWWTHLWLNEGFASYMEYKCVDELFPKWKIWEQYVSGRMSAAFKLDALQSTHPVEVEVSHPGEISEIFDEVSYAKGSVIIRMLAEYLGERKFRDGLRLYLKKHSYKNTQTGDLWKALSRVSGKPVSKIMDTWTKQPGYPLISAQKTKNGLELKQGRFYSSRLAMPGSPKKGTWNLPLKIGEQDFLLSSKSAKLKISQWPVKLNPGEKSLARIRYSPEDLEAFGAQAAGKKMAAVDRLGLVRDLFALAENGQGELSTALNFLKYFRKETQLVVWEEVADSLSRVRGLLFGSRHFQKYQRFCRWLLSPAAESLGWKETKTESHDRKLLRALLLFQLGLSGDSKVLASARKYLFSARTIPPNLKSLVYSLSARSGGKREYFKLEKAYINAASHEEQERLGRALAQFQKNLQITRMLKFSLSKHVRLQDAPFILAAALQNPASRGAAWQFIKDNWDQLRSRYGDGLGLLGRLIKSAGWFADAKVAADIEAFFKKNRVAGADRSVRQAAEKINSNADWLTRAEKELAAWTGQENAE